MNRKVIFKNRPEGKPTASNFLVTECTTPHLENGQVLIRTLYISVDPYMRERMSIMKSYIPPFEIGEVITGTLIGQIVETRNQDFGIGEVVHGFLGWQEYNVSDGTALTKIPAENIPYQLSLGTLGSPGITAYLGLIAVGSVNKGETVVISGAAGAVGTVAGQTAKLLGCRVIGITGSEEKNEYLVRELGFDAAINYKDTQDMESTLATVCPDGIDAYFDNVGNETINAVASLLNKRGRILLCGQISQYNGDTPYLDSRILGYLTKQSASIHGFLVSDFTKEQVKEARTKLTQWVKEGKLRYSETLIQGLENAPSALIGLFNGLNTGKMIVQVQEYMN